MWMILPLLTFTLIVNCQSTSYNCDKSCATCAFVQDPNSCTSCSDSSLFLLLVNNDYGPCVTPGSCSTFGGLADILRHKCFLGGSCPPGFYPNIGICYACPVGCSECYGGQSNQCLGCSSGYILRLDNDDSGTCILPSNCLQPYSIMGNVCAINGSNNCSNGCATCYNNSASQCKSCSAANPLLLFQPENYIGNDQWGSCNSTVTIARKHYNFGFDPGNVSAQFKCHWTCQTCLAENDRFACTSCGGSAFLSIQSEVKNTPYGYCKIYCNNANEYQLNVGSKRYCYLGNKYYL